MWRVLVAGLVSLWCLASDNSPVLARIREHMRDYVQRMPDFTCRVTIERSQKPSARGAFSVTDRLRLDIAYAGAREFYAWPGAERFENSIDELLPARGMVSEGSWALHMRKLFLTSDAQFAEPRVSEGEVELDFLVPVSRSGFAISAGGASAPTTLRGTVWFHADNLEVKRLEVRAEAAAIAVTRELTTYARETVGDVAVVLPVESELVLVDRDGRQMRNRARFDNCHRYAGSATVRFDAVTETQPAPGAAAPALKRGQRVDVVFERGLPDDLAVGDLVEAAGGVNVRITDLRQAGKKWSVEFSLVGGRGVVRKTIELPAPAGMAIRFGVQ